MREGSWVTVVRPQVQTQSSIPRDSESAVVGVREGALGFCGKPLGMVIPNPIYKSRTGRVSATSDALVLQTDDMDYNSFREALYSLATGIKAYDTTTQESKAQRPFRYP